MPENKEEKLILAKAVSRLLEKWQLPQEIQCELLGMMPSSRKKLALMRNGKAGIPKGRDALDRVTNLLSIHKYLTLLYQDKNDVCRYEWIKKRNAAFKNLTPLEVILEEGLIGLVRVKKYLNYRTR